MRNNLHTKGMKNQVDVIWKVMLNERENFIHLHVLGSFIDVMWTNKNIVKENYINSCKTSNLATTRTDML